MKQNNKDHYGFFLKVESLILNSGEGQSWLL